jgi:hypothetical protein
LVPIGLLEYGLIREKLFAAGKNDDQQIVTEKIKIKFFFTITKIFLELFLLVSIAKFLEVYDKKKKK